MFSRRFDELPLRRKLIVLLGASGGLVLAFALAAFALGSFLSHAQATAQFAHAMARTTASHVAAPLARRDAAAARAALQALRADARVSGAAVVARDGTLFAADGDDVRAPDAPGADLVSDRMILGEPVVSEGEQIGTLRLAVDLRPMGARVLRDLLVVAVALFAACILAGFWLRHLVRRLMEPLVDLADGVTRACREQGHTLCPPGVTPDELGVLADGFNALLRKIERREYELREQRDELERMVRTRTAEPGRAKKEVEADGVAGSRVLARLGHDLRAPLNSLVAVTDLLAGTGLDSTQQEFAHTARRTAQSVLAILHDILDYSRIEAGRMELEQADFDLADLVEDVAGLAAAGAHAKGVEILCDMAPDIPQRVRGDPLQLRRILTELATNAVRYTERGHVLVKASRGTYADGALLARFEVFDTGTGIAREDQARIFEPYVQAEGAAPRRLDAPATPGSGERQHGGSGLGLAICRELVHLMGGEIGLTSVRGHGSQFWFTARLAPSELAGRPVSHILEPLAGRHAVVLDDNEISLDILCRRLEQWGLRVTGLRDGARLLAQMDQARAAQWDVLLLDWHTLLMDGRQTIARIGSRAGQERLRIAVFGSLAEAPSAQDRRALTIDAWLAKPVRRSHLLDCLANLCGNAGSSEQEGQTSPGSARAPEPEHPYMSARQALQDALLHRAAPQPSMPSHAAPAADGDATAGAMPAQAAATTLPA